jgi:hypothetical protein
MRLLCAMARFLRFVSSARYAVSTFAGTIGLNRRRGS